MKKRRPIGKTGSARKPRSQTMIACTSTLEQSLRAIRPTTHCHLCPSSGDTASRPCKVSARVMIAPGSQAIGIAMAKHRKIALRTRHEPRKPLACRNEKIYQAAPGRQFEKGASMMSEKS